VGSVEVITGLGNATDLDKAKIKDWSDRKYVPSAAGQYAAEQTIRHRMERIEDYYAGRVQGKTYEMSQVEGGVRFAANEIPSRYAPLHGQIGEHINRLYTEKGVDRANGFDNTVASCTVECVKQKVSDVQQASVGNGNIHLGQKMGYEWNVASIDATQAARTPVSESFAQLAALDLQQSQQVNNPVQTQDKTRSGPTMG
jgi:hypothetical protein